MSTRKLHQARRHSSYSSWATLYVKILLEISVLMAGLFLWGFYDYRRAPKKLTQEQKQKLRPIAKAWDVTPEDLQDRVVPKVIMIISGSVGLACLVGAQFVN